MVLVLILRFMIAIVISDSTIAKVIENIFFYFTLYTLTAKRSDNYWRSDNFRESNTEKAMNSRIDLE
jgi:hypothetical protein